MQNHEQNASGRQNRRGILESIAFIREFPVPCQRNRPFSTPFTRSKRTRSILNSTFIICVIYNGRYGQHTATPRPWGGIPSKHCSRASAGSFANTRFSIAPQRLRTTKLSSELGCMTCSVLRRGENTGSAGLPIKHCWPKSRRVGCLWI